MMYESIYARQKQFYQSGKSRDIKFRIDALKQLKRGIKYYEDELAEAMLADFNKQKPETYTTEIGIVYTEINHAVKHLEEWASTKKVKTPITHIGSKSVIYKEPYGVTLIIAPWNYPFNLTISPLIGAISAGNTAVLKPSEHTPMVSEVITKIMEHIFPSEYIYAAEGGIETNQALLKLPFDYIFYTGSSHVGKIVMKNAAENLIPVTLELGGKSPAVVTENADLKLAAKRIVWAKFSNAGQTCVAPDFVYAQESIKDALLKHIKYYTHRFYHKDFRNGRYMSIVNDTHFDRIKKLIEGNVVYGGRTDAGDLTIEPVIIDNVEFDHPAMKEEIFGPVLPVLSYSNLDKAILDLRDMQDPLALYVFSDNKSEVEAVIKHVPFGGGAVNDAMFHLATPYLPFGGRGNSGMGKYHGKYSFDTFTHEKSILKQTTLFDMPFRYPDAKFFRALIRLVMK